MSVRRTYERDSVEFGRALAFSDGLFAIAMTLLIVAIAVPHIHDTDSVSDLWDALNDRSADFVSFFIGFAVIGRYWVAHHQSVSLLRAMDQRYLSLNLVYLAFIAFLPFPTALLGEYFENPLSIVIYAINVGAVSGMEVVLFRHAYRSGLLERQPPRDVYRFGVLMALSPVLFFAVSIPFAFISTTLAVCIWFLGIPLGAFSDRWKPEGADELLLG
jgi:TMEM175 potassium channel family protein